MEYDVTRDTVTHSRGGGVNGVTACTVALQPKDAHDGFCIPRGVPAPPPTPPLY